MILQKLKTLPCFPCPHNSCCCNYGVDLTDDEAMLIIAHHGEDTIYADLRPNDRGAIERIFRTCVRNNVCIFLKDNACTIHNESYYPIACKIFPYGHLPQERLICPEFK